MDQQLIIAGFHRSGTSFTTQVLQEAGLFVGDDLLGANPSNPYGHYEDMVPYKLHQDILRDNGVDWRMRTLRPFHVTSKRWDQAHRFVVDRRSSHRLWGFKDPRVCLFLGMWKHLLPQARILIVFRDYGDAVWSLRRRHARNLLQGEGDPKVHESIVLEPDLALDMWVAHNEALLAAVRQWRADTLVVPLSAIQQGYPLTQRLNHRFGLGLRGVEAQQLFDPDATTAVERPLPVGSLAAMQRAERTMTELWNAADVLENT